MGEKIKQLLTQSNRTQAELAETVGVSQAFISGVVKGYKIPSVAVAKRIANFFNIKIDELLE